MAHPQLDAAQIDAAERESDGGSNSPIADRCELTDLPRLAASDADRLT